MKKSEVTIGMHCRAKVSDQICTVRIDAENPHGGWDATNLRTGKRIRIKSAQRLRGETRAPQGQARTAPPAAKDAQDAPTAAEPPQAKPKAEAAPETDTGERRGPAAQTDAKAKRPSGLDAAAQVLAEADGPLNARTIVERMLDRGLWQTSGKTPAATIYAAIIREIAVKGDAARFRKVARGKFELAK